MTGCLVSLISSTMAGMAPLSALPNRLSASSSTMSFLLPSLDVRNSPSSPKVLENAPLSAVSLIASPVLWSEAFISIISQPMSLASASAEVVFPIPGGPMSTTALVLGVPTVHCFAHAVRSATALGLPTTADRVFGRYFSVQSGDTLA